MENMNDWDDLEEKSELNLKEMDALIRQMNEEWDAYEKAKAYASELKAKYDLTEMDVVRALESAGKTKYQVEGLGTAYISNRFTYKVPKDVEAKTKLFSWIEKNHGSQVLQGLITINHQTLNSFTKVEIEKNPTIDIPGLGQPTLDKTLGFRKSK
jgi:hypothetical protein